MGDLETGFKLVPLSERHIVEYAILKDLGRSEDACRDARIKRMATPTRELFEEIHSVALDSVHRKKCDAKKTIVVRDRKHLDALLGYVQVFLRIEIGGMPCRRIMGIDGNVVDLDIEIKLNFLDVSKVTDMSGLFKDFDVSPCPEKGWHCRICLNIDGWNLPNETNIAHTLGGKYVEIASLDKWKRVEASCLESS